MIKMNKGKFRKISREKLNEFAIECGENRIKMGENPEKIIKHTRKLIRFHNTHSLFYNKDTDELFFDRD